MRFYIGGFTWSGENQLERFEKDGIWQNGYGDDVYYEVFKEIQPGDLLALKSTYVTGKKTEQKKSSLRIANIGIVESIPDTQTIKIKWLNVKEQRHVGVTWFSQTLIEITDPYYIDLIFGNVIREISMDSIIPVLKHKKQIILQGAPGTGKTYTAKDLAEKLITGTISANKADQARILNESGRFKLVQFHPSYTYDDFVRGIVIENVNNGIAYSTKDKPFLSIANDALKNLNDSMKSQDLVSYEQWLEDQFDAFKEYVSDIIETKGCFELTKNVAVFELDERSFIYKGDDWGNRMKFNDIKQAYIDDNKNRQEVKHNKNLSRSAFRLASYYIRILDSFRDFLQRQGEAGKHKSLTIEKVKVQNYVIVIDEINRANLPAVLGELIYALEYRNEQVDCPYAMDDDYSITIPENLYVIGTMNTADRSVGQIDYAIRRRFAFINTLPRILSIPGFDEEVFRKVSELFISNYAEYRNDQTVPLKRSEYLSDEFCPEDVWLGHSYFIMSETNPKQLRVEFEIKPILREYVKDGILKTSAFSIINELR